MAGLQDPKVWHRTRYASRVICTLFCTFLVFHYLSPRDCSSGCLISLGGCSGDYFWWSLTACGLCTATHKCFRGLLSTFQASELLNKHVHTSGSGPCSRNSARRKIQQETRQEAQSRRLKHRRTRASFRSSHFFQTSYKGVPWELV